MKKVIDMEDYEIKKLETQEEKKEQKSYESPNLTILGKMQRVTLGEKSTSSVDNLIQGLPL